ncbi:MAG: hypothetical protein LBI94_06130 [Treponema sp.]|jgi:hypothetical protein|nr:hypothetical protein [Treponema sp.]
MMTAEEAAAAAKDLTFEKVWVMLQEISREADRRQAEVSREMKELSLEADRRQAEVSREMKEMSREVSREIKELSRNIGGMNNAFGRWIEEMVSAKLWEKFRSLGYTFTRGGPYKFWEGSRTVVQVDMLLENGDYALPVEIKSTLTTDDVDDHIERIRKVREQLDKRGDRRKLVGAVAGMAAAETVRKYAQKKGLYVLVQSGDSVALAETDGTFRVREW